jgi:hypothetical protein
VEVKLVAHTGFEPVISSLRGTRPRPLDECAFRNNKAIILLINSLIKRKRELRPEVLQAFMRMLRLKPPKIVEPYVSKRLL